MLWLLTKFAVSAAVIVAVSEIAKRSDKAGALIASLPLVTLLALVWLHVEGQPQEKVANHAWYTFWACAASVSICCETRSPPGPLRRHRLGRDRRLLASLALGPPPGFGLVASARSHRAGRIRLASDLAPGRLGSDLCGLRGRLRHVGPGLALGR